MSDEGTLTIIRDLLEREARVDERGIDLVLDDGAVVLRGSVPDAEQATAAALLAEEHADEVRNELRVDVGLRDDPSASPGGGDPRAPLQGSSSGRDRPRNNELSVQTSAFQPEPIDDGVVSEVDQALAENVPWDPPDSPQLAPTQAEQRGVVERDQRVEPPADAGPVDADTDEQPSAADMSQAELAESVQPREEE